MKAKEMFEELGGQLEVGINGVFWWYVDDGFVKFTKTDCQSYETNLEIINIDIHKAIHQQMKELGWLDE